MLMQHACQNLQWCCYSVTLPHLQLYLAAAWAKVNVVASCRGRSQVPAAARAAARLTPRAGSLSKGSSGPAVVGPAHLLVKHKERLQADSAARPSSAGAPQKTRQAGSGCMQSVLASSGSICMVCKVMHCGQLKATQLAGSIRSGAPCRGNQPSNLSHSSCVQIVWT